MLNTSSLISLCCVELNISICALSMCTDCVNSLSFLNKPDINNLLTPVCVSGALVMNDAAACKHECARTNKSSVCYCSGHVASFYGES